MFVDMTEEEREAFFEENGKSIGDMDFDKNLTEDELSEMKDEIYRLNDELMETTEEKGCYYKTIWRSYQESPNADEYCDNEC